MITYNFAGIESDAGEISGQVGKVAGLLACRVNRTRHVRAIQEELRRFAGGLLLRTVIRENIRLAEAPSFRQPITIYAPDSIGAEDYRQLAREIMKQEGKA